MSKRASSKNDIVSPASFVNEALTHHVAAETSMRQGAAHAALSGLALRALKNGPGRGGWEDWHAAHIGDRLPLRMAQRYMQVAEGLQVKAKQLPELDALLATPAAQMTEEGRARLAAAVESIADGETMSSLIEAYRISKRPPGTTAAGGYKPSNDLVQAFLRERHTELVGTLYSALPEPIQAEFREWYTRPQGDQFQLALDYYSPVIRSLDEDASERRWIHLPHTELERMADLMETRAAEIREALRQRA